MHGTLESFKQAILDDVLGAYAVQFPFSTQSTSSVSRLFLYLGMCFSFWLKRFYGVIESFDAATYSYEY